jgi:hypothetical protein
MRGNIKTASRSAAITSQPLPQRLLNPRIRKLAEFNEEKPIKILNKGKLRTLLNYA